MTTKLGREKLTRVLFRIKRGLAGYVSYLQACEMKSAFSEYVLYEPILRILKASGYRVSCEHPCPGIAQPKTGDKKRIDFYGSDTTEKIAIEVKWAKKSNPNLTSDLAKLRAVKNAEPKAHALLVLFGSKSVLEKFIPKQYGLVERGDPRYADLGVTRYGCRIFKLPSKKQKGIDP